MLKKNIKRFGFLCILCILLSVCVFAQDGYLTPKNEYTFNGKSLTEYAGIKDTPEIVGYSAYAINLNTGTLVYEKNSKDSIYPASTVKLMTAIVVYENTKNLDEKVVCSQGAIRQAQGANMALVAGEELTVRQLLYGLLVRGANDAALVLAEHIAGNQQNFVDLMNKRAKELGAVDTHFDNVTGFHNETTVTTARDIAIIAQHLYYIPELFEITNTTRYTIEKTQKKDEVRTLINRNMLLSKVISEDYYYSKAKGMSLGSTPEGGYCVVSTATGNDNMTYLCVVMNSKEINDVNYACVDICELFDFCFDKFSYQTVISKNDMIEGFAVKNAVDVDEIALFSDSEIKVLLPKDIVYNKDISVEKRLYTDYAKAPVNKGDIFGEIVVRYKNEASVGRAGLVSNVVIDRSNLLYFFSRVESIVSGTWFIVFIVCSAVMFCIYFGLSVYYKYFRKSKYTRRNLKKR